jgi:hypothetical protein
MQAVRNSFPPFQTEDAAPRDQGNKKAAPSKAPPSPKEILIPSSLPDWIIYIRIIKNEIVTVLCFKRGPRTEGSQGVQLSDAIAATERSNFLSRGGFRSTAPAQRFAGAGGLL